ncbi:MAG TPA: hypothetical protein VGO37_01735 [Steroidobacteraceae bacterium]|jgi:hypothetical protein|nr:hypothetical protein [Steroidobacteraceae bacterium]
MVGASSEPYTSAPRPLWGLFAPLLAGAAASLLMGCVSPKYKAARNAPPARPLDVRFPAQAPLDATLNTLITFGGPGSWKREAFWDEYVVSLHNEGDQPVQVASVTLVDYAGIPRSAGDDPWALERQSKDLEKRYRDAGMTFARMAGPRVLAATAEPAVMTTAGVGSAGAAAAAATTAVALPVYGLTVLGINSHNKSAIKAEFNRRRLPLPLRLGPGETRTGSLFFPMVPNPRSLALDWTSESGKSNSVLALDFLGGLHMASAVTQQQTGTAAPPGPN